MNIFNEFTKQFVSAIEKSNLWKVVNQKEECLELEFIPFDAENRYYTIHKEWTEKMQEISGIMNSMVIEEDSRTTLFVYPCGDQLLINNFTRHTQQEDVDMLKGLKRILNENEYRNLDQ